MPDRHTPALFPQNHTLRSGRVPWAILALLLSCFFCSLAQAGPETEKSNTTAQYTQEGLQTLFGATARKLTENEAARTGEWHNWQRVIGEGRTGPPDEVFAGMPGPRLVQWKAVCTQYAKASPIEQLRLVSGFFNNWASKPDSSVYGVEEYWATAQEFLQNAGGDCEDYAIVKYEALRFLGWDINNLWIVLVSDNTRVTNHAVLVARSGKATYVLDNLSSPGNLVMQEDKYRLLYTPIAALSHDNMWVFSKENEPAGPTESFFRMRTGPGAF